MIVTSGGKIHVYGDIYNDEEESYDDMRSAIKSAAESCKGHFEMVLHDARVLPSSIIGILVKIVNMGNKVTLYINNDSILKFMEDMNLQKMLEIKRL